MLEEVGAALDLRLGQADGQLLPDRVRIADRGGVHEDLASRQPRAGVDDEPPQLPALIVEQEVVDGSDLAVAGRDREPLQHLEDEEHGAVSFLEDKLLHGANSLQFKTTSNFIGIVERFHLILLWRPSRPAFRGRSAPGRRKRRCFSVRAPRRGGRATTRGRRLEGCVGRINARMGQ